MWVNPSKILEKVSKPLKSDLKISCSNMVVIKIKNILFRTNLIQININPSIITDDFTFLNVHALWYNFLLSASIVKAQIEFDQNLDTG